ncbi:Uncharacterised protein [Starkeya nomas]|uniref:Phage tail protein n=1 Tax=Starkeya nomas TaxID=2666134 RepID=A0A5S9R6R5_9HYPH|nr:phage tail protein [Starkeya nomas]CAA0129776.1 Uncharacterised protein [Starkeya nomas]
MAHDAAALLPTSAGVYERTLARATDPTDILGPSIDALHGRKLNNPPASALPYLVWEYGLGMLSPYLPNLYDLLEEGVDWERVRGTPAAVHQALGWIGYSATLEYAPPRRRWWNHIQLGLDRVRDDETDLVRIDGLTWLSLPLRSDCWRAHCGYDVRALEADEGRADETMWDDDSGVVIDGVRTKWSFGRPVYIVHDMAQAELEALGVWLEPIEGADLTWGDFPWGAFPWTADGALARSSSMMQATGPGPAWAVFKDVAGAVLFYRRCRVRRPVIETLEGVYRVGASRFDPAPAATRYLYVEALTAFGEGHGSTAASVGFILSATPAAGFKPGLQHLPPGALEPAGPVIGETPINIEFGRTVRERVACLLRF